MLSKRILVLMFVVAFLFVGCFPAPTPSNQAPILTSSPVTTATVGVLYTYDVNATDPDGDTLTYSLDLKPSGMIINSANGLIKWTPTAKGDHPIVVKVSDGSLSITQSFTIKVSTFPAVNQAPVITSSPNLTATVGVTYIYDVNATDPDGDTLTYYLTTNPSGMAINPTNGLIWWTPTTKGTYTVVVNVSDGALSDTQGFNIVVSKPTVPPETYTITSSVGTGGSISPLGDVTVIKGSDRLFTITPDALHSIEKVLADGVSVGAVASYTFNNVAKDHTIHATFSTIEPEPEPEPELELTGIVVDPKTMDLVVGKSEAIKSVTATYEIKGSEVPIALGECTYESDDEGIATVTDTGLTDTGLVEAVAKGTAIITVSYGGKTDDIEVTVSAVKVVGIEVSSSMVRFLSLNDFKLFTVAAIYNDGSTLDVTSDCIYGIGVGNVTVDEEKGKITPKLFGKDTITVVYTPSGQETFTDIIDVGVGRVHNTTQDEYYETITDAITDVSVDDTIEVVAGTYTENLVIDKQLTLQGAGSASTIIDASTTLDDGITVFSGDVTIQNLSIIDANSNEANGIYVRQGGTNIRNNIVLNDVVITGSNKHGVRLDNFINIGNLQITDCQFTNNGGHGLNSESTTVVDGLTITDSHLDSNTYGAYIEMEAINVIIQRTTMNNNSERGYWGGNGRVINLIFEDCQANGNGQRGISVWSYDATNGIEGPVLIRRTEMNNNGDRGFHIGAATTHDENVATTVKNVLLEDCSISNNGNWGIHVDLGLLENVVVRNCNIEGNSEFGIKHDNLISSGVVDATENWWGAESGPHHPTANPGGTGDAVSDNVDFDPWL